jgi:outer membrane protein
MKISKKYNKLSFLATAAIIGASSVSYSLQAENNSLINKIEGTQISVKPVRIGNDEKAKSLDEVLAEATSVRGNSSVIRKLRQSQQHMNIAQENIIAAEKEIIESQIAQVQNNNVSPKTQQIKKSGQSAGDSQGFEIKATYPVEGLTKKNNILVSEEEEKKYVVDPLEPGAAKPIKVRKIETKVRKIQEKAPVKQELPEQELPEAIPRELRNEQPRGLRNKQPVFNTPRSENPATDIPDSGTPGFLKPKFIKQMEQTSQINPGFLISEAANHSRKKKIEKLEFSFFKKKILNSEFDEYQIVSADDSIYYSRRNNVKKSKAPTAKELPSSMNAYGSNMAITNNNFISNYNANVNFMNSGAYKPRSKIVNSMESLLADAYRDNPELNAARVAVKAADEALPQAFSGFLPSLSANYAKGYNNSGRSTTSKERFYPETKSLDASVSVFGGGETYYAVKAAENNISASRTNLKSIEQAFLQEAINAYIEVIFSAKVLKLSKNNENVLTQQLNATTQRYLIGDATRTDVAQSEARLANAVSDRVIAKGDYINAKSNFKRIFLIDPPAYLPMPGFLPKFPEKFDQALRVALDNNPDLLTTKFSLAENKNNEDVERSQLFPQVDVNGSLTERENVTGNSLVDSESESVTVNVSIPLYNSGLTYSRIREARDRKNEAYMNYQNTLNRVHDQLIQAWQDLTTTASNIEATKSSLVASEYALEGVREEQKEGVRSILDVLDAEQERFSAEVRHARAIKDSVLAVYNLKAVLGELTAEELKLPIRSYDPTDHYNNTRNKLIGL